METAIPKDKADLISLVPKKIPEEVVESDYQYFLKVISTTLTPEQQARVVSPPRVYPHQEEVLAIHWHPEFIPMELIAQRIEAVFPGKRDELIIPTQHNVITSYGGYSGVEVDCYSRGFNQKVQILLHFKKAALERADVLKSMLHHTFKYRSSQLFDFIHTITEPRTDWLEQAAKATGANENLIRFVQVYVRKMDEMFKRHADLVNPEAIKNKLLRDFFDCLRAEYSQVLIDRAQTFLNAVKAIVKAHFPLDYFYRTSEVIEEARSLGAGIVIPHPEQFWPILLAEYDVDGYEVWNPQSQRYTEFLVSVLNRKNRYLGHYRRPLIMFMGDDTHMSEKVKDPIEQDPDKVSREIGVQTAWEDLNIRKALILANMSRRGVIEEYRSRLEG